MAFTLDEISSIPRRNLLDGKMQICVYLDRVFSEENTFLEGLVEGRVFLCETD